MEGIFIEFNQDHTSIFLIHSDGKREFKIDPTCQFFGAEPQPGDKIRVNGQPAVTLGNLSAARMDHEVRTLRALEMAFKRVDEPDYGECEDCGGRIPVARLIANPAAIRCVACQERYEHTYAGQAHGSM